MAIKLVCVYGGSRHIYILHSYAFVRMCVYLKLLIVCCRCMRHWRHLKSRCWRRTECRQRSMYSQFSSVSLEELATPRKPLIYLTKYVL